MPKKRKQPKQFQQYKGRIPEFNAELAKVKKEHKRLPDWGARIVAADHFKIQSNKRD